MSKNLKDLNNNDLELENAPPTKKLKNACSFNETGSKKTVFEYGTNQIYELLLLHGVSIEFCDAFLNKNLNGAFLFEWNKFEFSEFKIKLHTEFNELGSHLTDKLTKHLFAIVSKYKINSSCSKYKVICDSVHGQIEMHPLLIKIIDTPQFQRLRYLKQLGALSYVFPCANHSRFEHSIGTSHLAGKLIKHLAKYQPSLKITNADELCVRIAGLCHDLGHGPFSHMFEEVIERFNVKNWKHEMATIELFERMLNNTENLKLEFESFGLFENDIQLIKDLIYNNVFKSDSIDLTYKERLLKLDFVKSRGIEKSFLFEIVSNNRNGIDVDKFDYFDRDCKQMGFTNNFNYNRYILYTRVVKAEDGLNQICVRDKEKINLYEMFHVREYLTRRGYKHETGSSINLMIIDALEKANGYFKFSEMIRTNNYAEFEKLDDSIFLQILHSTEPLLKESKEILERITKRKLYKYIGRVLLTGEKKQTESYKNDLIEFFKLNSNNEISKENVVIDFVRFNYGSKNKDPLENVRCYNKYSPDKAFQITKNQLSEMLPDVFEDVNMRIYSKIEDLIFIQKIETIFKKWCQSKNLPIPLHGGMQND